MNIVNPSVLTLITNLKEEDSNIRNIAKRTGLSWQKTRTMLYLMHYYGLIEINGVPKLIKLTEDGITVKNILTKLDYIMSKNEEAFKKQILKDVEDDILL